MYDIVNELDHVTNKLEDAKTLIWSIFENYLDRTQEFINNDSATRDIFVGNYGTIADLTHLVADMLFDIVPKYRTLSDEIKGFNLNQEQAVEISKVSSITYICDILSDFDIHINELVEIHGLFDIVVSKGLDFTASEEQDKNSEYNKIIESFNAISRALGSKINEFREHSGASYDRYFAADCRNCEKARQQAS